MSDLFATYDIDGNRDDRGAYLRSGALMDAGLANYFIRGRQRMARPGAVAIPDIPADRYDTCVCGRARFMHGYGVSGLDRRGLHLAADWSGAECDLSPDRIEIKFRYGRAES